MKIVDWDASLAIEALSFLKARYESSMFLLGKHEEHGAAKTDHPNSAHFSVLIDHGFCRGVFCLSQQGNLLLQLDDGFVSENVLDMIGDLIQLEKSSIKGVLGPWHAAAALWDRLRDRNLVNQESFRSKQILYRLGHLEQFAQSHDSSVRYLARADFKQWRPLRESFLSEEGLQLELSDVQLKHSYDDFVSRKLLWGLFDSEQRLVAMAGLNSKALNIGQIGGVYTVQSRRRQGLSSRTLLSMMADCYNELGIGRMILFTAEDNTGAQRLYESLGFLRVGHFGMIFS